MQEGEGDTEGVIVLLGVMVVVVDADVEEVEETVGDVAAEQDVLQFEPDNAPPLGHVYTGDAG